MCELRPCGKAMEPVWHGDVLCKQNSNVERRSSGLLPCRWVRQHAGRGVSIFEAGRWCQQNGHGVFQGQNEKLLINLLKQRTSGGQHGQSSAF